MAKSRPPAVTDWTAARITSFGPGIHADEKFLVFPRGDFRTFPFANPVIVRKKSGKKTVVAASYVPNEGQHRAIMASQRIRERLDCGDGDEIEFKTATFRNVVWAKKVTLTLAVLGWVIAVGAVALAVAAMYPGSHQAFVWGWIIAGLTTLAAAAVAAISLRSAYTEP